MSSAYNIVVFISGTGSNLASIIDKQQQYNYTVSLVISNKKNANGLDFAKQQNIPTFTFNWDKHDRKLLHVQNIIKQHDCQLIVLAGFMKILPEPFVTVFNQKIINIHPSLLPKYPGLSTHQRVIDNGDKTHGASVHYVNTQLDAGKIISQSHINIDKNDDAESLARLLLFREHSLLPYTIGLICQNRVRWQDNELYFDNKILTTPIIIYD
ncbi:MAG: phosphoribosylglycinamide formyltransferase [Alcanivoracaceae bacterium]|nr:phosphoribosylglycinamide formyltransferase [Alcanivoracaceae bacterium]